MKGLKKLTLASAIVAAPFASQAMEALDDATMGDVTGQAGVTIVTNADLTIGSISYTDGDGDGSVGAAAGTLTLNDIGVEAQNGSAVAITQTIDVTDTGLQIGVSDITDLKATVGSINIGNANSVGSLRVDADISGISQTISSGGNAALGNTSGLTINQSLTVDDVDVLYVDTPAVGTSGSAVLIENINTNGAAVAINQNIDVVDYDHDNNAGTDDIGALAVTSNGFNGTLNIGGVRMLSSAQSDAYLAAGTDAERATAIAGVASIGTISVSNISMTNTTTYIYAH